jgi:hypothetical protein
LAAESTDAPTGPSGPTEAERGLARPSTGAPPTPEGTRDAIEAEERFRGAFGGSPHEHGADASYRQRPPQEVGGPSPASGKQTALASH